jgi:O-antigen/teichoic acid export membrane protein
MLVKILNFNVRHIQFFLRGITLLSRVIFLLFIAKNLSVAEVGFYGFIAALIFATVFIVGFEYGNYSSRHIIKCRTFICKQEVVVNLTIFGLIMFFLFASLLCLVTLSMEWFDSYQFLKNSSIILFFIFIAYGESYIAEHKKILISLSHPIYSGVVDFIKGGIWAYLLIIFVLVGWMELNLKSIFLMWSIFVVLGAIMLFIKLKKFYNKKIFFSLPSFDTYRQQISSSLPFFLSGLFLVLIELSGRVSLQIAGLNVEAGVYTLYAGFIFSIPLFVWSSSVAFDHPQIIKSHEDGDIKKSDYLVIVMLKRSLLICVALIALLYISFDVLIYVVEKEEYLNYISQFHLFLIIPIMHVFDTHLYYMLYTRHMDKLIAISAILGGIFLIIFQYLTVSNGGIKSVILSIIFALIISVLLKFLFIRRSIIKHNKLTQSISS